MILREMFEDSGADAAFCFGRFNPAHQGHIAVWQAVQNAGRKWFVGTNPNTIGPNDPLPFNEKTAWMKAIYPDIKGHIIPETSIVTVASKIFQALQNSNAAIAYVTDSQDWQWAGKLLNDYNGKEGPHGYYKFRKIIHVESPRVSSATALRTAARAGDEAAFYAAAGTDPKLTVNGKTYFETVVAAVGANPEKVKKKKKEPEVAEGWSDRALAQRTDGKRTPYSVYIKGRKWKDFESDDHARSVMNKLKAKFKSDGRDPETITIAPTDYDKNIKETTAGIRESGVGDLEKDLKNPHSYNAIDHMMQTIAKKHGITPKQLHDQFVKKHNKIPDEWAKKLAENFADGRNPQDKGDSKRHGINTKASVSSLRKTAKSGGRKGQLAHWLANMKAGRAKKEEDVAEGRKKKTRKIRHAAYGPGPYGGYGYYAGYSGDGGGGDGGSAESIRHRESADNEYNDEAGMAQSNLLTLARAVKGLLDTIKQKDNLPEWAQEKIAKAEMMLVSVWDYLQSQKERGIDPKIGEAQTARDKWNRASAEREKKHNDIEAKRQAAAAQGKENMSAAIDRLADQLRGKK